MFFRVGWLKTFEKYYQDQTRKILDNMVIKLASEPKMKFIYAEVSFFERWWTDADDAKRQTVKKSVGVTKILVFRYDQQI